MEKTLLVVPHTHWDREWYRPFESYRVRLIRTITRILDGQLPHFLLDGQTVAVDDYLAMHPEKRTRLLERVARGDIGVGPWYVLVDEFLVSQESLIRNLLVGRQAMTDWGAQDGVGYLPDMFGHIAQMPQILRGFGMDAAVLWRGANPDGVAFNWRGPDGSQVRVAHLPKGYYQTMFMAGTTREARDQALKDYLVPFEDAPFAWLLSGADHMAPQMDLTAQLKEVSEVLPGWQARVASLADVFAQLRPEGEISGELRDPGCAYILPGVLSARVPLKQANVRCQTLLERYVEPLCALSWWQAPQREYPAALVRHAWMTLMKNHPHDSICGCSIDQVHREMWPRFAACEQVGEELLADALQVPEVPVATPSFYVFNPTNWDFFGWLDWNVDWPLVAGETPEAIALVDAGDEPLAMQLVSVEDTEVFCAGIDLNPDWHRVRRFRVRARVTVPALGGLELKAQAAGDGFTSAIASPSTAPTLESDRLTVTVRDGQVLLRDRIAGVEYARCLNFVDEADAGDEYNFSPLMRDEPIWAVLETAAVGRAENGAPCLRVTHRMALPVGLNAARTAREMAGSETVRIDSEWRLTGGGAGVSVDIRFDNVARDHRLRAVFCFGQSESVRVLADSAFGVFERACAPSPDLPVAKGVEAVMPEFPQASFSVLQAPAHYLCVVGEGLHEASFGQAQADALAVTVLRSVGWLSRDDLRTRGGGAGPRFETPEAQCLGSQHVRFALFPGAGEWEQALPDIHQYLAPPRIFAITRPILTGSAVRVRDPRIVLSALKRAESGHGLIVRFYNPTGVPISTTWQTDLRHGGIVSVNLGEELLIGGEDGGDRLAFGPYEVITRMLLPAQLDGDGAGEGGGEAGSS